MANGRSAELVGSIGRLRLRCAPGVERHRSKIVPIPIEPRGEVSSKGRLLMSFRGGFTICGWTATASARDLAYRDQRVRSVALMSSRLPSGPRWRADAASLGRLCSAARFEGRAALRRGLRQFELEGNAQNIGLEEITRVTSQPAARVERNRVGSGAARRSHRSGPASRFHAAGQHEYPRVPKAPFRSKGNVDVIFDQSAGSLRLGNSVLRTGTTPGELSGTLGQTLRVGLKTGA